MNIRIIASVQWTNYVNIICWMHIEYKMGGDSIYTTFTADALWEASVSMYKYAKYCAGLSQPKELVINLDNWKFWEISCSNYLYSLHGVTGVPL